MRLIVCVKRDLHGCVFLNHLLPQLVPRHQVDILLSDKTRVAECQVPALVELAYLERTLPIERIFPLLDQRCSAATVAGDDKYLTFAGLAASHRVRCRVIADIDSPQMLADLRSLAPDLIVSARFSHIFRPPAMAVARFGVVNIHPGELPAYAGLFAPMRTIADGHRELAVCLHYIDAGIDSGPILAVERLPYEPEIGLLAQLAALYPLAITPLLALIARLEQGETVCAVPQDAARRRYRSWPSAEEFAAFLAAGHHLWTPASYDRLLARFLP